MTEKLYKLEAPMGSIVIPKEYMTEKELREFAPQLIQDPTALASWQEKIDKDPIEELIEWLVQAGYKVTER